MSFSLEILDREWSHPDADMLRQAQQREIAEMYGTRDSESGTRPSSGDISVFVIAYTEEGHPVACGALRQLLPAREYTMIGNAEIKRMYVVPSHRGQPWNAAKAILKALEQPAQDLNWTRLVLETGKLQAAAIHFYEREGYALIPNFGAYAGVENSLCYGRTI